MLIACNVRINSCIRVPCMHSATNSSTQLSTMTTSSINSGNTVQVEDQEPSKVPSNKSQVKLKSKLKTSKLQHQLEDLIEGPSHAADAAAHVLLSRKELAAAVHERCA